MEKSGQPAPSPMNTIYNEGPKVPSYEEAMNTSYPVLPPAMGQMTQPLPMQQPYPTYQVNPPQVLPVLPQPQVGAVIHQNVTMIPVGPHPTRLTCPSCHELIQTNINHVANTKTHLAALLLCLLGCFCCACCPYCMDDCQNTDHLCPNCGAYIGTYQG